MLRAIKSISTNLVWPISAVSSSIFSREIEIDNRFCSTKSLFFNIENWLKMHCQSILAYNSLLVIISSFDQQTKEVLEDFRNTLDNTSDYRYQVTHSSSFS